MSEPEDDEDVMGLAYRALRAAEKAFLKVFEDDGTDAAYFDFRFTAWLVDCNFEKRLERIEIEREVK
jgi:hypothetical protein